MSRRTLFIGLVILGLFLFGCTGTPQPPPTSGTQPSVSGPVPSAPQQNTTQPTVPASVNNPAPSIQNTSNSTSITAPNTTKPEIQNTTHFIVRGRVDPDFEVSSYDENRSVFGTTLMADNHIIGSPRIIEVNMLGEIVWEYDIPAEYAQYNNPGLDVERLSNGNVLIMLPRKGVFEVNRKGETVWSYLDPKVSHTAHRLQNGNTLIAFGASDTKRDSQVKEVDPSGRVVWSWSFASSYDREPYASINDQGWTHTNAVARLPNGNTLVNSRNFNILVEVDRAGNVVRETNAGGLFHYQHDPEIQQNGTILFANHATPNAVYLIDWNGTVLWSYVVRDSHVWPVRDADMLSNGNILVTGANSVFELTPQGETVWLFKLKNVQFDKDTASTLGFYKAERLPG